MSNKPIYQRKDADGNDVQTLQPEVFEAVKKEVAAIGDNTKKLVDTMQSEIKQLRAELEKNDGKLDSMSKEKVDKLSEAIISKQEALEKALGKRVDDIELAFKRGLKVNGTEASGDVEKEAKAFAATIAAQRGNATYGNIKADVAHYEEYKAAFTKFLHMGEKHMSADEMKALLVASDPDGGLLVPPQMSARIIQKVYEADPIRSLASVETISSDTLEFIADLDQAGYGWQHETASPSETTTPQFRKISIPTHIMYAEPRATQKLIEDANINAEAWLADKVAARFGRIEGAAFITGDGVGKPRGFLTYANGTTFGTIEQTNMGAAATITTDGLIDVKFSLLEEYQGGAAWLMNRLTVSEIMKLKDGDGQYIWRAGIMEGAPSTLLGSAVRMSTTMPQVAANALSIVYGNLSEGYVIVDRAGISVLRDPFTAKPFIKFYTTKRVGGDVVDFDAIKIGKVAA